MGVECAHPPSLLDYSLTKGRVASSSSPFRWSKQHTHPFSPYSFLYPQYLQQDLGTLGGEYLIKE